MTIRVIVQSLWWNYKLYWSVINLYINILSRKLIPKSKNQKSNFENGKNHREIIAIIAIILLQTKHLEWLQILEILLLQLFSLSLPFSQDFQV